MNWVGGVRNRLKTKDEKQRQKAFFEKMKYGSKVKQLKSSISPKKGILPSSLDLLSLQAADFSAQKFRKSDTMKSSKSQVKKVELDRSRGLFPLHHHGEELELPMSPGPPSNLQLQDSEQGNASYLQSKGPETAYPPFTTSSEHMEHDAYGISPEEDLKMEYSDCQSYPTIQLPSHFHSTPMVQGFSQAPQQHQGKGSENLFFSCIPNDTLASRNTVPDDLSTVSDEQFSGEFDYSPLSSIPSESSATSSVIMLTPESSVQETSSSQPTFLSEMPVYSSQQGQQFQNRERHSSSINHIRYTVDQRNNGTVTCPMSDTSHSEDPGLKKVRDHHMESHPKKPDSESALQQVDLTCEEEETFLSPFCKQAKNVTPGQVISSTKTIQKSSVISPEISMSFPSPRDLNDTVDRGKAIEEQNSSVNEDGRSVPKKENSFKWQAFVSGHAFREKPAVESNDRPIKKARYKVCKQLLNEVLQLDSDLCQQSPLLQAPTSEPGSRLSTKLGREQFSSHHDIHVEGEETRRSEPTPDQQVPTQRQSSEKTESPVCDLTVEFSEPQQGISEEPIQTDNVKTEKCDKNVTNEVASDGKSSDNTPVTEELESSESLDTKVVTSPPASDDPVRIVYIYKEKATQCNILTLPVEDKTTLCESQDLTPAATAAEPSVAARPKAGEEKPACDAYDECILS